MRISEYQRFAFGKLSSDIPNLKIVQAIQILKFVIKDLNSEMPEITDAKFEIRFLKLRITDLKFVKPGS